MNIIFLDLDGVLINLNKKYVDLGSNFFPYPINFSSKAIKNLKKIIDTVPNTKIVISSNWGKTFDLQSIILVLSSHGLNGPYVLPSDVEKDSKFKGNRINWLNHLDELKKFVLTPKKLSSEKCHEIAFWLSKYSEYVNNFVILDDKEIFYEEDKLNDHFILVDGEECLTIEDSNRAISLLNNGENE